MIFSVCVTLFASLCAPFAGFLASGFKRAFGIKDFAETLPGHGGFVDRLDCISLMGIFNFSLLAFVVFKDDVYYNDTVTAVKKLPTFESQMQVLYQIAQKHDLDKGDVSLFGDDDDGEGGGGMFSPDDIMQVEIPLEELGLKYLDGEMELVFDYYDENDEFEDDGSTYRVHIDDHVL